MGPLAATVFGGGVFVPVVGALLVADFCAGLFGDDAELDGAAAFNGATAFDGPAAFGDDAAG